MVRWGEVLPGGRIVRLGLGLVFLGRLAVPVYGAVSVEEHVRGEVQGALQQLGDPDPDRRLVGMLDLALLAAETWEPWSVQNSVQALIERVDAPDAEESRLACQTLLGIRWRLDQAAWSQAIIARQLREALNHPRPAVRIFVARLILHYDPLDTAASEVLLSSSAPADSGSGAPAPYWQESIVVPYLSVDEPSFQGRVHDPSPRRRRMAGLDLLVWARLRGTNSPLRQAATKDSPRWLDTLARDSHPSIGWIGVAGWAAAAANPDLGPVADECRRRLDKLLRSSDPGVRCRFASVAQGIWPPSSPELGRPQPPHLKDPTTSLALTRDWLGVLLRRDDPLLKEHVLAALGNLGLEPPSDSLKDARWLVRLAAVRACRPDPNRPLSAELRETLRGLLADPEPEVAAAAAMVLVPFEYAYEPAQQDDVEAAGLALVRGYRPDNELQRSLLRALQLSGSAVVLEELLGFLERSGRHPDAAWDTARASLLRELARVLRGQPPLQSTACRLRLARLALAATQSNQRGVRANGLLALGELLPELQSSSEGDTRDLVERLKRVHMEALRTDDSLVAAAAVHALMRFHGPNIPPEIMWSDPEDQPRVLRSVRRLADRPNRHLSESAACVVLALSAERADEEAAEVALEVLLPAGDAPGLDRLWEDRSGNRFVVLPDPPWAESVLWAAFHSPDADIRARVAARAVSVLSADSPVRGRMLLNEIREADLRSCPTGRLIPWVRELIRIVGHDPEFQWNRSALLGEPGPGTLAPFASGVLWQHLSGTEASNVDGAVLQVLEEWLASEDADLRRRAFVFVQYALRQVSWRVQESMLPFLETVAQDPDPAQRVALLGWLVVFYRQLVQEQRISLVKGIAEDLSAGAALIPDATRKGHLLSAAALGWFRANEPARARAACREALRLDRGQVTRAGYVEALIQTGR